MENEAKICVCACVCPSYTENATSVCSVCSVCVCVELSDALNQRPELVPLGFLSVWEKRSFSSWGDASTACSRPLKQTEKAHTHTHQTESLWDTHIHTLTHISLHFYDLIMHLKLHHRRRPIHFCNYPSWFLVSVWPRSHIIFDHSADSLASSAHKFHIRCDWAFPQNCGPW